MGKNTLTFLNTGKNLVQRSIGSDYAVTAVRKIFPSGMEIVIGFKVPFHIKKADYILVLKELKRIGFSQKISAFLTGISPSYVSKLLKM